MAAIASNLSVLSCRGGELIELTGDWPTTTPLTCTVKINADTFACYSAQAGQGAACIPSGRFLRCGSPRLPDDARGNAVLEVRDANQALVGQVALTVAAPFYPTTTYLMRSLCPTVWATGPRQLADEAAIA